MSEPYTLLPLTREQLCHLFLTLTEKAKMLEALAGECHDPSAPLAFLGLNESILAKIEPDIVLLGIESDGTRPRGPKRAPAGQDW